jgi:hypothetical protein
VSTPFSRYVRVALLLPLVWGTADASAQQSDPLIRGDRLRLSSEGPTTFEGVLETSSVEGLTLADDQGESAYVPYASLLKIERAGGRNRRKGALIGGAVGFFVGAVAAVATGECVDCDDPYGVGGEGLVEAGSAGTGAILGGILLGGVGAVVGGLFAAPQRWIEISFRP